LFSIFPNLSVNAVKLVVVNILLLNNVGGNVVSNEGGGRKMVEPFPPGHTKELDSLLFLFET